jgi:hypothetical protein
MKRPARADLPARLWGAAMGAAASISLTYHADPRNRVFVAMVSVVLAALLSPPVRGVAPVELGKHREKVARTRGTMFCLAFVVAVGVRAPSGWLVLLDAVLFCGYLLLSDLIAGGAPVAWRASNPLFAGAVLLVSVGVAGLALLPRLSWPVLPLVAACAAGLLLVMTTTAALRRDQR